MLRWQRAVVGALLACGIVLGGVGCKTDRVSPEEAADLAAATVGPLTYTTTYAADLPAPLGVVDGTIEGEQTDLAAASFVVSATAREASGPGPVTMPPRSLTLTDGPSVLGRLAVVPSDVLGLIDAGGGLESDGTGRGYGQDPAAQFREDLDPVALEVPLAGFVTELVGWLVGPVASEAAAAIGDSVTVTGATLELLVLRDGSAVDSAVLRVDYEIDGARFSWAVGPYLPAAGPTGAPGPVAGSAEFRVAITG